MDAHSHLAGRQPLPPENMPGANQSSEQIWAWLSANAAPGAVVVIRHVRWDLYEYHLDRIEKVMPGTQRVVLAQHGTFDFRGDCNTAPKDCLTLLAPQDDVVDAAINGHTWLRGQLAFKRPLSASEREIILAMADEAGHRALLRTARRRSMG